MQIASSFQTKKYRVLLDFRKDWRTAPQNVDLADLVIAGCYTKAEREVEHLKNSKSIVARYSRFFGKPSEYTGKLPEETGYALDLIKGPNPIDVVTPLLQYDNFLDGLMEKDGNKIAESAEKISNVGIQILAEKHKKEIKNWGFILPDKLIIATPYLEKVTNGVGK